MSGAIMEGGYWSALLLLMWAALPGFFIWKLAADPHGTLSLLKSEPVEFILMVSMIVGMAGWFSWLLTDGDFSSPWCAALVVGALLLRFMKGQLCARH